MSGPVAKVTRLRRWIFCIFAAASLLISFACAALWVRSYFHFDDVVYVGRFHVNNFCSLRGRFFMQFGWFTSDQLAGSWGRYASGGWFWDSAPASAIGYPAAEQSRGWKLGGFDVSTSLSKRKDAAGRPVAGEHVVILAGDRWTHSGCIKLLLNGAGAMLK